MRSWELAEGFVSPGFVQLVGGDSPCSGYVEIREGDQWKTVCDSDFGPEAAAVVCRDLQCGAALPVHGAALIGEGIGAFWDRELRGFRLVNGSTACDGRVEVQVHETWGTLCASHWDLSDAHVLCRHLNCGFAESLPRGGLFAGGTSPIWRDSFHCDGTEAHLGECPVTVLGASPCSHENIAAVICSGPPSSASLRLVGGESRCDGRVEIFQHGTWGRVLDDQWEEQEASVVCRQLQCGEAERAYNPPKPEKGTGPVGLRGVRCAGHEANLTLCNTSVLESTLAAGVAEDVGVVCQGSRRVRLVNGQGRCAGRVEIYHQGSWGTVCDDGWDLPDATVVCRQLGCGGALEAPASARFGEGSGQIWLDGVNCSGAEGALWDCPPGAWGQHDCGHKEDAGVNCSEFVALRLENSTGCSGRLQVLYNGTWGSVCSNSMTPKAVSLACKELGCGDRGFLETQGTSGTVSGVTWLDRVECGERSSSFWQCLSDPWDPQSCNDPQDETHISCNGAADLRLENGGGRCAGRVEMKQQGQWGTVCGWSWDMDDAAVVCKQLGCGSALKAHRTAHFGPGSGPIWLFGVQCKGTESALSDCTDSEYAREYCDHRRDAGVTCSGFVQLVGGDSPCSGYVEIRDRDQWKSVCDSDFGPEAAAVVCRDLQCGAALPVHGAALVGEGIGAFWDRELQCVGNEPHLASCPRGSSRGQPCPQDSIARVTCTRFTGFRLVNGSTACDGRVEVQVHETWGTLCASHWDLSDAHVLCRHLNCGFAESLPRGGRFGGGTSPIWRDSFHCDGTEAHLGECPVTALGASPCSQENIAAVICSGPPSSASLRLVGGESRCDGRVEIFQHGTWGRVLDDQWDEQEASVVCRQLRCGKAEKAYNPPKLERGTGPVGLRGVRCAGHEANLTLCNTSVPESTLAAGVAEDVGVVCWGSQRVRLVNGQGRCAGRVEIYHQGSWGTVCNDDWDLPDATVVCRQLGCGGALEAPGSARFGEGSGQIWLDGVNCSGAEGALWDCPPGAWGKHDCGHKEDAGVNCSEFVALRLENSTGCSGRLQVLYNGTWGSVCSNSMTPKAVSLACKELGCGDRGFLETQGTSGTVSNITWLDRVECGERSSSFWQCPSDPWDPQSCNDPQDETHISCNGKQPEVPPALGTECPSSTSCTDREKIRAIGGKNRCSGRVEVWHRGSWGTVCDDSWDMRDAEVACRQLGCGPAVSALGEAAFGEGSGPIWLERVECQGTELSLQDCWAQTGDRGLCRHKEDAAVNCSAASTTAAPPPRADPTRAFLSSSGRISLPVIICIILGALLCLLLALLAGQVRSARAERRGSKRAWEPFSEAVYEEIGNSPSWEKQARFSGTGSHSEGSLTELHPKDSKEEDGLGSLPGDPADGYDDAREVPDPEQDPVSGPGGWEMPGAPEKGAGPRDTRGESTGYDDAEEMSLAYPPEDTQTGTQELSAQQFLSPRPAEPIPAVGLGAARREERTVQLGEP
ncbi:scavenger receptor cysteine-rich type 1 protein M130-like [Phaenicophaeus curvirostris]|uniref:scavenger receptor cysteine-rich type 1 protein M130-like n=1 Tax=Phaenicophaeus curvirostris TaxID=33595 RepID=UPI0037F0C732